MTLARIICDTSGVTQAQAKVMEGFKPGNERINCQDLPPLDLTPWKEIVQPKVETIKDNPGKTWLIKSSKPNQPQVSKLSGYIQSISFEGVQITLPIKFPTEVFQAVSDFSNFVAYPPVFNHGLLWAAEGSNKLTGNFSLPFYGQNQSTKWYNGNFSIDVQWEKDSEPINGKYSSPLYFFDSDFSNPEGSSFKQTIEQSDYPKLKKITQSAPIILNGTLSPDNKFFTWFGNFSLILPKQQKIHDNEILQLAYTPTTYKTYTKISGKVSGGSISAQGETIWSGKLPLAIPKDPFDTISDTTESSEIIYGHGINWKGSVLSTSANTASLSGSFSLPIFAHSTGISPFSIHWYNGDISINFDVIYQSSSLSMSGDFTTYVYFADRKQYHYLKDGEPIIHDTNFAGSPRQSEGLGSKLILLGAYSGDVFLWSGNFTLILPQIVPITSMSFDDQQALRLIGGEVNVDGQDIWYNNLPLGIPVQNPLNKMIWTGSVQPFGDGFIKILGNFSFPVGSSWVNGKFNLQFQSNETFSLSGRFSTTIRLEESPTYEEISQNSIKRLEVSTSDSPKESFENSTNLSVTLLGIFSTDRSEFLWSGRCVLQKPRPILQSSFVNNTRIKINGIVKNSSLGSSPKNIPIGLFESVLSSSSTGNEPPVFGQSILWNGEFLNKSLLIHYSLPVTSNGKLSWYNGNLSMDVDLDSTPSLKKTYSSVVFLKVKNQSIPKQVSETNFNSLSVDKPSVDPDTLQTAPIIIYGEYLSKNYFQWNGEITIIVPNSPDEDIVTSSEKLVLPAFANGGSITSSGSVIWVGNRVPLAIPSNFLEPFESQGTLGIPWKGYIASDVPNTVKIWGTYSAPENNKWFNGDFAFDLKLLGGMTTDLHFNDTYLSRFYYHEISAPLVPEWNITLNSLPTDSPQILMNSTKSFIPVILHGAFTEDRVSFIWSGNVTIIVSK